ncbi:MAG: PP2C family serine/threonine-protein phosphatase [Polyangiaceae bacterium]
MFDTSSTLDDSTPKPPLQGVTFGQATDVGRIREQNEDHLAAAADIGFFVVADGVGGAPGGAEAARLATAEMLRFLRASTPVRRRSRSSGNWAFEMSPDEPPPPSEAGESPGPRLIAAALGAHQMIRTVAARKGLFGAATTMAALWVTGDRYHIANTGDSRVYRLREDGLQQLSKDHTLVQEYKDIRGEPPGLWARHMENVVTQVLGGRHDRIPAVHLTSHALTQPEVFLLCTDGLTKMVNEADIAFVLRAAPTPQQAAEVLVELANDWGGVDNTTVIIVRVEPVPKSG